MANKLEDFVEKNPDYKVLASHDTPDKKVVIIGKEGHDQKYIRAVDGDSKEYIISMPWCSYHREIKWELEDDIGKGVSMRGGGRMYFNGDVIEIYDKSIDYGEADHERVAAVLENLGLKVEVKE